MENFKSPTYGFTAIFPALILGLESVKQKRHNRKFGTKITTNRKVNFSCGILDPCCPMEAIIPMTKSKKNI